MERDIKIEIKTEHIQALLEGKKLTLDYAGQPRIVLIPDRYGVFMTFEKLAELRRKIAMNLITSDSETVLRDVFGDELYEKVMTEKPKR
jgi:hypothetical protein